MTRSWVFFVVQANNENVSVEGLGGLGSRRSRFITLHYGKPRSPGVESWTAGLQHLDHVIWTYKTKLQLELVWCLVLIISLDRVRVQQTHSKAQISQKRKNFEKERSQSTVWQYCVHIKLPLVKACHARTAKEGDPQDGTRFRMWTPTSHVKVWSYPHVHSPSEFVLTGNCCTYTYVYRHTVKPHYFKLQ